MSHRNLPRVEGQVGQAQPEDTVIAGGQYGRQQKPVQIPVELGIVEPANLDDQSQSRGGVRRSEPGDGVQVQHLGAGPRGKPEGHQNQETDTELEERPGSKPPWTYLPERCAISIRRTTPASLK